MKSEARLTTKRIIITDGEPVAFAVRVVFKK
jgi:hypothetical protein